MNSLAGDIWLEPLIPGGERTPRAGGRLASPVTNS